MEPSLFVSHLEGVRALLDVISFPSLCNGSISACCHIREGAKACSVGWNVFRYTSSSLSQPWSLFSLCNSTFYAQPCLWWILSRRLSCSRVEREGGPYAVNAKVLGQPAGWKEVHSTGDSFPIKTFVIRDKDLSLEKKGVSVMQRVKHYSMHTHTHACTQHTCPHNTCAHTCTHMHHTYMHMSIEYTCAQAHSYTDSYRHGTHMHTVHSYTCMCAQTCTQ